MSLQGSGGRVQDRPAGYLAAANTAARLAQKCETGQVRMGLQWEEWEESGEWWEDCSDEEHVEDGRLSCDLDVDDVGIERSFGGEGKAQWKETIGY